MDIKIHQSKTETDNSKASAKTKKSLFGFIQDLKEELKKVTWTSQEELRFSTKMVIWAIFIFGLGIYVADLCIKGFLEFFKAVIHIG